MHKCSPHYLNNIIYTMCLARTSGLTSKCQQQVAVEIVDHFFYRHLFTCSLGLYAMRIADLNTR